MKYFFILAIPFAISLWPSSSVPNSKIPYESRARPAHVMVFRFSPAPRFHFSFNDSTPVTVSPSIAVMMSPLFSRPIAAHPLLDLRHSAPGRPSAHSSCTYLESTSSYPRT